MIINLQTVHFKGSPELEAYVHEKVGKLFEQNSAIIHADVILSEGANGNPENKWCEITLAIPGNNHVVKKIPTCMKNQLLKQLRHSKKSCVAKKKSLLLSADTKAYNIQNYIIAKRPLLM